jgi:hypothetical protein
VEDLPRRRFSLISRKDSSPSLKTKERVMNEIYEIESNINSSIEADSSEKKSFGELEPTSKPVALPEPSDNLLKGKHVKGLLVRLNEKIGRVNRKDTDTMLTSDELA